MKRCIYGMDCRNRDVCQLRHPDQIPCKFGDNCKKIETCPYRHVPPQPVEDPSLLANKDADASAAAKSMLKKKKRPRKLKTKATTKDPPNDNNEPRPAKPAVLETATKPTNETTSVINTAIKKKTNHRQRGDRGGIKRDFSSTVSEPVDEPELEIHAMNQDFSLPSASSSIPNIVTPTRSVEEQVEHVPIVEAKEETKPPNATNMALNNNHKKKPIKKRKPRKKKPPSEPPPQQVLPGQDRPVSPNEGPPPNQAELLDQLRAMGFTNEVVVLKALQETKYRLDRTITALLIAREADILRIQEATNSPHTEASAAFEYTNGDILAAIHYLRQQMRAKIQFATTEELGQAVFVTARQKRQNKAQRQKAARKKRQRKLQQQQQALLQQEETQKAKRNTESTELDEHPMKEIVATDDSQTGDCIGEEIEIVFEPIVAPLKQQPEQPDLVDNSSLTESDGSVTSPSTTAAPIETDQRKAAKKERQRLRRLAEPEVIHHNSVVDEPSTSTPVHPTISDESFVDDEEKKRRFREELKRQKHLAAEKRSKQKHRRYEEFRRYEEEKTAARTAYWDAYIHRQEQMVKAMVQLCIAEFCSKHSSYTRTKLSEDQSVQARLKGSCRSFLSDIEVPTKVKVSGLPQFEGRTGTVVYWDDQKQKFLVRLPSKKHSKTVPLHHEYVAAEHLEAEIVVEPVGGSKRRTTTDRYVRIAVDPLIDDIHFSMIMYRSELKILLEAKPSSVEETLDSIILARREEERLERERVEVVRREEEKAKARRERQRKQEKEEWEARQREYQEYKRQYEAHRAEEAKRYQHQRQYEANNGRRHHGNSCGCAECVLRRYLFSFMTGSFVFVRFGSRSSHTAFDDDDDQQYFYFNDDDDDDDDGYDYDRQWNNIEKHKRDNMNQQAADLLGVSVDATADEIKRVYRRKALRYHPDKYRAVEHEMTEEEAADHFKELNNAYDHLLSNFD